MSFMALIPHKFSITDDDITFMVRPESNNLKYHVKLSLLTKAKEDAEYLCQEDSEHTDRVLGFQCNCTCPLLS